MHTVDLAGTWWARGDRNRDEDLWMLPTQATDDGSLARCGRSGKYGEVSLRHDRGDGGGVDRSENSAISAAV